MKKSVPSRAEITFNMRNMGHACGLRFKACLRFKSFSLPVGIEQGPLGRRYKTTELLWFLASEKGLPYFWLHQLLMLLEVCYDIRSNLVIRIVEKLHMKHGFIIFQKH